MKGGRKKGRKRKEEEAGIWFFGGEGCGGGMGREWGGGLRKGEEEILFGGFFDRCLSI